MVSDCDHNGQLFILEATTGIRLRWQFAGRSAPPCGRSLKVRLGMNSVDHGWWKWTESRAVQLAFLVALVCVVGTRAMQHRYFIVDTDIWWHLRVGDWILLHHAMPHTGLFSWTADARPWMAYSWGFEILLSRAFAWGGLLGIGIFCEALTLVVAASTFWMVRRLSGRFWLSLAIAAASCDAFLFTLSPRPVFLSMALFAVVLTLLIESQRDGRMTRLYWLPLIFLIWANLHIQFVYGLFLVGLFLAAEMGIHFALRCGVLSGVLRPSGLSLGNLCGVFAGCLLATLLNPYTLSLYRVILDYSKAQQTYSLILELQSPAFRSVSDFVGLFLVAAAFYVIGWRKQFDPFQIALLVIASVVGYRTLRDGWFVVLPAAACIADLLRAKAAEHKTETAPQGALVALVSVLLLAVIAGSVDFDRRDFDRQITSEFPVKAANFLRRNPLPGPLYNVYNWGGFLIWYLPQYPVAVDGRNDLYGAAMVQQFTDTQNGTPGFEQDPFLAQSNLLLLQRGTRFNALVESNPQFEKIYEDKLATIYQRKQPAEGAAPSSDGVR